MGNSCCAKKNKETSKKVTLLLVGLDNAGKTVAAKNLAGEPPEDVVPTVGFSVINLKYQKYKVSLFDLGGSLDFRGIWDEYFVYAHGIIFVVDSSDYTRLEEAKNVLNHLLSHNKVAGKPILLLANKQDDVNALDEIDLVEKLQLEQIVNSNRCPTLVETCCAEDSLKKHILDTGIKKGYRWLMNYITNNYGDLNMRVNNDVKQHEEKQRRSRLEIIERMRALNEQEEQCKKDLTEVIELCTESDLDRNNIRHISNGLLINKQEDSDNSSVASDDSLPHIYHVKSIGKEERPKSAVQLVKEQLEMEQIDRASSFKRLITNKTAPMSTYGLKAPHSASERRTVFSESRRTLKSAGDSIFIVSDLPNSVPMSSHGDNIHHDLFRINNFDKRPRLPPLKVDRKTNGNIPNGTTTISIIEVE